MTLLNITIFIFFNIFIIYIYLYMQIKERKKYKSNVKLFKIIFLLGIYSLIIAIGRPVIDKGENRIEVNGLKTLIALDFSASMRSEDIFPNRLEFAKKKMIDYINILDNDEVGIVGFSNSSFLISPFSSDKNILINIIKKLNINSINMRESNFLSLANLSAKIFRSQENKILILFSDGGEKKDLAKLSEVLKKNNISLYVVFIGTEKGAPILDNYGKVIIKNNIMQISKINLLLGKISIKNGGFFIIGNSGNKDIKQLITVMKNNHKNFSKREISIKNQIELFYYFIILGLLLIFLSTYLATKKNND